MPPKKPTANIEAIDLFCGIGGLTYGLRKAGIRVLAGIDNDVSCQYAYEANNDTQFVLEDIAKCDFRALKKLYSKNAIKVLVGCAPCQPFSAHTYKIKDKEQKDTRWNLIQFFSEAVKVMKPDIVSMENVVGFVDTAVFNEFVNGLKALGYKVNDNIVFCPDYGVPQSRKRLVLLASKLGGEIKLPRKTHQKGGYNTVRNTIGKLPPIAAGDTCPKDPLHRARALSPLNLERIRQSKPNGTWRDWDKSILPKCYTRASGKNYGSVYGRMGWDGLGPTITTYFTTYGCGRFGHPDQDRPLSVREGALLQTFPQEYDFGERTTMHDLNKHIGNAVPPKLGRIIGKSIHNHIQLHHA